MNKDGVTKKGKKIRSEAHEIIAIMAILGIQALEHRHTRFAKYPSTVGKIFGDQDFIEGLKENYAHDKDLKVLADNFKTFLRVIEKVERGA